MSDIQEEQKRLYKRAEENDKEKWIDISKENRRLLKKIHNIEIKELKQEEHKNLELSMRINKVIEYIKEKDLTNNMNFMDDGIGNLFKDILELLEEIE